MLLIVDNQSAFIKRFKGNYLADQNFDYIFYDHNQPLWLKDDSNIKGIILSGGKGNPYQPLNLTTNFVALMNFDVPVLGFCLGHEIIAVSYRGRIKKLSEYNSKKEKITITKTQDPIFNGLNKEEVFFRKQHSFHVIKCPPDFESLGFSNTCQNEIIKHKEKPIYGFQSHPEVSGKDGLLILTNFIKMCGIEVEE